MIAAGFIITVVAVATAIVALVAVTGRRTGLGSRPAVVVALAIAGWLAATGIAARAGGLHLDGGPPRMVVAAILAMVTGMLAIRSTAGRHLTAAMSRSSVVGLQSFRIAVELVLWQLAVGGLLPVELTFEGRNFDVLVGLTALPVALVASRRPIAALVWHVAGLALLANIVGMAVLSAPGPQHVLHYVPANTIVGEFPYVWLPAFLVPVAAIGHLVGIRQALATRHPRNRIATPA